MTLDQFMFAYQENLNDIFILHDSEEVARFTMSEYFTAGFNPAFGDRRIDYFMIGVVNNSQLTISIFLHE